ncbi:MAG: TetR family transcriptional regulator [Rubrivivax sp.]|nr:TetR family transcriptional regulator [Rubrivivax sp.]
MADRPRPRLRPPRAAEPAAAADAADALARTSTAPTREQILAAAARLFGEQGYASTTLRQIAAAAGIKAGSIYYHFVGKDEIAACVLDAGIGAMSDAVHSRLGALRVGAGARERLAAAVEGHLSGMLRHGEFTAAHIRIYRYVSDAARQRHRAVRSAYTHLWDDLLAEAAAAGLVRGDIPVPMIRQFLVGALNWPVDWYDPRRGSFEQIAAQITAMVFDGITLSAARPLPKAPAAPAAGRRAAAPRRAEVAR